MILVPKIWMEDEKKDCFYCKRRFPQSMTFGHRSQNFEGERVLCFVCGSSDIDFSSWAYATTATSHNPIFNAFVDVSAGTAAPAAGAAAATAGAAASGSDSGRRTRGKRPAVAAASGSDSGRRTRGKRVNYAKLAKGEGKQ